MLINFKSWKLQLQGGRFFKVMRQLTFELGKLSKTMQERYAVNPSSEVDLIELFRDLAAYKWMILIFVILAGGIAGGYAYMATPVYEV
ncbi:Wzz/FepE/Etk N-terminal domain-containing protein, partial [Pseudomonas sp. PCH446]